MDCQIYSSKKYKRLAVIKNKILVFNEDKLSFCISKEEALEVLNNECEQTRIKLTNYLKNTKELDKILKMLKIVHYSLDKKSKLIEEIEHL